MTELMGWLIVLGFIVTIGGMFMLSIQIERHTQNVTSMLLHSNEMLMTHIERSIHPSVEDPEAASGVILDRRRLERRNGLPKSSARPISSEQRRSSGRRTGDIPANAQMGFSRL